MSFTDPVYVEAVTRNVGDLFKDRSGRGPWRILEARVIYCGERCHKAVWDEKAIIQFFPIVTLVEPVTR